MRLVVEGFICEVKGFALALRCRTRVTKRALPSQPGMVPANLKHFEGNLCGQKEADAMHNGEEMLKAGS